MKALTGLLYPTFIISSLLFLGLFSLVSFAPRAEAATLLYENGFENGWGSGIQFSPCNTMYSWTFNLENKIVRSGGQSARFENRGDKDTNNDICNSDHKYRAQLRFGSSQLDKIKELGKPMWYGFSVFVPNDHPTNQNGGYIALQFNGGCTGPEFDMVMLNSSGSEWRFSKRWTATGKNSQSARLGSVSTTKGKWQDIVIYRERSWGSDGVTRVWVDGKQIVNDTGPNAINYAGCGSAGDSRPVIGIYWGTVGKDSSKPGARFVLFYDDLRIAEGTDGYALVDPAQSGKAPAGSTGTGTGGSTGGNTTGTAAVPAAKFTIGDKVQVSETVVVRSAAAGTWVSAQVTGSQGTIIGGPVTKALPDGTSYTWWNVNYNTGKDGWSAEPFLFKKGSAPSSGNTSSGSSGSTGSTGTSAGGPPPSGGGNATLLYENLFTNGLGPAIKNGTPYVAAGCDNRYWPDFNDPMGGNNPSLHIYVPGDLACATGEADRGWVPKHRAQISDASKSNRVHIEEHKTYFTGYKLWIPSGLKNAFGSKQVDSRVIHMSFPDKDTATFIENDNGIVYLVVYRRIDQENIEKYTAPLRMNTWNNIVLMNIPARDNTGEIALWVDGKQIFHRKGVQTMGTRTNGNTNVGIYWAFETRPLDYELYIDDWRIASGPDGYALVDPSNGANGTGSVGDGTDGSTNIQTQQSNAKFTIGDKVQVSETVVVRSAAAGTWVSAQVTGSQGTIIGGPVTKALPDGTSYTWWNINYNTGKDGWSAEPFLFKTGSGAVSTNSQAQSSGSTNTNTTPTSDTTPKTTAKPTTTTTPAQTTKDKFQMGDRVETTDRVNVRNAPTLGRQGAILSAQPQSAGGTVIDGPLYSVTSNGKTITWWNINYDNGTDGWSYELYLVKVNGGVSTPADYNSSPISLNLSGAATESSITLNLNKPANATNATVILTARDADFPNEGTLKINNHSVINLFGKAGVFANNMITKDISFTVPVSDFVNGANIFTFDHASTGGYQIKGVKVLFDGNEATGGTTGGNTSSGSTGSTNTSSGSSNTSTNSQTQTTPTSVQSAKFTIGDKIQVSETVVVRSAAAGTWVSAQVTGSQGTIIGGPVTKALPDGSSYTWWNVNYNTGKDGWSAEPFLFKSGTNPTSGNTSSGSTGSTANTSSSGSGDTGSGSAKLIYDNDFSARNYAKVTKAGTPYRYPECDSTYWPDFNDPTGGNNPALHIYVPGAAEWACATGEVDQGILAKHRAEVQPNGVVMQEGRTYYTGYRMFIPKSGEAAYKALKQLSHYSFPSKDTVGYLLGGSSVGYRVLNRTDQTTHNSWDYRSLKIGQWNTIVIKVKESRSGNGEIAAWVNGTLVVDQKNLATMGSRTNGKPKIGIYWSGAPYGDRPYDYEMYIDDWKIAEGTGGYALVDPAQ